MMSIKHLFASAALLAGLGHAHAVSLSAQTLNGNSIELNDTAASLVALELGLNNGQPLSLTFTLDGSEDSSLVFEALLSNLSGWNMEGVVLTLGQGATFTLGTVSPAFAPSAAVALQQGGSQARITFAAPGEGLQAEVGDWFGTTAGAQDWRVNLNGLSAGQSFTMTVAAAVPEPESWALMLAGLGVAAVVGRRRV